MPQNVAKTSVREKKGVANEDTVNTLRDANISARSFLKVIFLSHLCDLYYDNGVKSRSVSRTDLPNLLVAFERIGGVLIFH